MFVWSPIWFLLPRGSSTVRQKCFQFDEIFVMAASEVAKITISGAASEEHLIKMTT